MNILRREKILSRFVYFSVDDETFKQQHKQYLDKCGMNAGSSNLVCILALVERINNSDISIQETAGRLRRKNVFATSNSIRKIFIQGKTTEEQFAFSSVRQLREAMDKTQNCLSPRILFNKAPVVSFDADDSHCCGKCLKQYKTKDKTVYTMHIGEFIAHERNNTGIVEMMDVNGGYILHIDALGDKGRQRLISGVDSISDFVLGNAKIQSEHSDYVAPFLKKIKKQFGTPLAVVQDMGKGIMKAVEAVFPKIKILICHFHFLRDIGKDLLENNYDIIRKRLRHFGFLVKLRSFSKELKFLFDDCPDEIDKFHEARISGGKINLSDDTGTAFCGSYHRENN